MSPHEFRRSVQRLMLQYGWDAFSTDGPGDAGGDLYCEKDGIRWIIQSKWKRNGKVGSTEGSGRAPIINQALNARSVYDAHKAIIVTNGSFSSKVHEGVKRLIDQGIGLELWEGIDLIRFSEEIPQLLEAKSLRIYQAEAKKHLTNDMESTGHGLLYLATGLGKTVVAGSVIREVYKKNPAAKVLVLVHTDDLIEQIQRSLWADVPLDTPSQLINSMNSPKDLEGLTVSTNMSIEKYIEMGYRPDLLLIDECHHVGESNTYGRIIESLEGVPRIGVTATPWRGDGYDVKRVFGEPSYSCSIEEGMQKGYLSPIEYKLYCDNVNWSEVPVLSENEYTVRELNRKLFIPQRDETIIDALTEEWLQTNEPKCIVFCQSISHAKRIHELLRRYDRWKDAEILHSKQDKNARRFALLKFRSSQCNVLVAVDILNEGIDVPNVNIVCFARVTHSRRLFVQQLGRGLRISPGKEKVVVLDFVADIRRLAEIHHLREKVHTDGSVEVLPDVPNVEYERNNIKFTDQKCESLIKEWIKDIGSLESMAQESRLSFPELVIE